MVLKIWYNQNSFFSKTLFFAVLQVFGDIVWHLDLWQSAGLVIEQ